MKKIVFSIFMLLSFSIVYSEEQVVDENELFGDKNSEITVVKEENHNVDSELSLKKISFSGEVYYKGSAGIKAGFVNKKDYQGYNSNASANIFLDVRIKEGMKLFVDFEGNYYSKGKTKYETLNYSENGIDKSIVYKNELSSELLVKELFFDTNYQKKLYFRFGKQNLKWGTGYFWNPTDTINIEKKSFLDLDKRREGSYGVKTTIPLGNSGNIYIFLNSEGAKDLSDNGVSLKYEFLVKNSEMSVSLWSKRNRAPILGYDISGRTSGIDFYGEAALSYGSDAKKINEKRVSEESSSGKDIYNLLYDNYNKKIYPKVVFGGTKYFDYKDIKDRISLTAELYYNGTGYSKNVIKSFLNDDNRINYYMTYFEPNDYGRIYAAFFSEFKKFQNDSRKSIHINGISNLSDKSGIINIGYKYIPFDEFIIETNLSGYFGNKYSEYMLGNDRFLIDASAKLLF